MTELALIAFGAIVIIALLWGRAGRGIGSMPVRSREFMTKRERNVRGYIEQAVPNARVHAQVSMGALLAPRAGLNRSQSTTIRNRLPSKRVDLLLECRLTRNTIAIVELDDRTHYRAADAQRDRMTAKAGYTTIRLGPVRHSLYSVRETLNEGLADLRTIQFGRQSAKQQTGRRRR